MRKLRRQISLFNHELDEINKEIQNAPQGKLWKRGTRIYQVIGKKQIGITKNFELQQQLARKEYLFARNNQIDGNLSTSDINDIDLRTPLQLLESLPQLYRNLPISYFYHPTKSSLISKNKPKPEHFTPGKYHYNGVNYKSQGERFIAETIDYLGLSYLYEEPFHPIHGTVYPDFQIKCPFTSRTILAEFHGAFHIASYGEQMNNKLDKFASHGLVEGFHYISLFEYHIRNKNRITQLILETLY